MSANTTHVGVPAAPYSSDSTYYTSSYSPYLQGSEILQVWQLTNYVSPKIRGNISLATALSGSVPGYGSTSDSIVAFSDNFSPQNYGVARLNQVDVYTIGRDPALGPTGKSQYITFLTSGSLGFVPSGSLRSSANLDVKNKFETYVSHIVEKRDLGQSNEYDDSSPFYEPDIVENDPTIVIRKDPETLVLPTSLVLAATPASLDGVIEPLTIRSVIDRSSIELPYVARSIKGSLSISDEKRRSTVFDDKADLRQISSGFSAAPFLDYVSSFASIDQPGAFSDAEEKMAPFSDTNDVQQENFSITDTAMVNVLVQGFLSASVQYTAPNTSYLPTYVVVARHGFTFSQNDNFGYDSIAFGGLKK
jgi:hypothetical protein